MTINSVPPAGNAEVILGSHTPSALASGQLLYCDASAFKICLKENCFFSIPLHRHHLRPQHHHLQSTSCNSLPLASLTTPPISSLLRNQMYAFQMLMADTSAWNSTQLSSIRLFLIMVWDPHSDYNSLSDTDYSPPLCSSHSRPWKQPAPPTYSLGHGVSFPWKSLLPNLHLATHPTHLRVCCLNITSQTVRPVFYTGPLLCIFTVPYNSPLSTCHDCNYLHNFYPTPTTALSQKAPWGRDYICLFHFCEFCTSLCIPHNVGIY